MKTLRSRLLLGTTTAMAAVLAVAGWALYERFESALLGEVDRALAAQARVLASAVTQAGRTIEIEFVELDLEEIADPEQGEFLQLWASGHYLYGWPATGQTFEPEPGPGELTTEWFDLSADVRGRVVTYHFNPRSEEPDDDDDDADEAQAQVNGAAQLTLVLAGEARAVDQALATLRALLGIVGLVTLVTAGIVLVGVVRRSLRPVARVSDRVAAIGEESLATRLDPSGVPGELLPVVQRVNGLLERLEAAFERERAFSNDVAHELRTPLAGLRTTLEVTAKRSRSEAEYAEALHQSAVIVGQLQSMVERLLQLARLDSGRTAVSSEPYVLGDVAVEAWEPFAAQAVARNLSVDLTMENGLEVSTDRELVEMILRNLYENAVTYADTGGEVRISTRSSNGQVSLEVWNTGSHLDQEQAMAATQRFWRGDSARSEAGLHCGLGLALVEKAAGALEGEVDLRARSDGEFAVEVKFPA